MEFAIAGFLLLFWQNFSPLLWYALYQLSIYWVKIDELDRIKPSKL